MVTTHKINMDLVRRGLTPRIDMVQDDKYSRNLNIRLYENGAAFLPPEGCHALVRFSKPDRTGGAYDAMPDGSVAWKIEENELTIGLAPQVCTAAGRVQLMVSLLCGDAELNTFAIELNVQERVAFAGSSREYINIKWFVPQPASAKVGDYLRVKEVDAQGRILAVDTFYSEAPDHRHDASEIISGVFDAERIPGEILTEAKQYADSRRICNLLDNSDFTRLIAQAGIGGSHGSQPYAGDRWILDSGTVTGTANSNGDGYSGITLNGTIRQKVPSAPAAATAAIGMVSGTAAITYSGGEVTITSSGGVIRWAALYEAEFTAETLPAYQPKGFAAELAECQRYFQVVKSAGSDWITPVGFGYATSDTNGRICIPLVAQMRDNVVPSINWISGTMAVRFGTGTSMVSDIAIINSAARVPTNSVIVSVTTTGLTANQPVILTATGAELQISADR